MLFDKLCKVVERHDELPMASSWGDALLRACLIGYTEEASMHRREFQVKSGRTRDAAMRELFLPFKITAVEDHEGVVVLADAAALWGEANAKIMWQLTKERLNAIGALRVLPFIQLRADADGEQAAVMSGVACSIEAGLVIPTMEVAMLSRNYAKVKAAKNIDPWSATDVVVAQCVAQDLMVAIDEIDYFNSPDVMVVSASNVDHVDAPMNGKIPRSHQRPRYMAVPRSKVLRVMGVSEQDESEIARLMKGHPRRAHWRELRSERFVNKRGNRVKVKESWIGPEETVVGNVRYRVHLGPADQLGSRGA